MKTCQECNQIVPQLAKGKCFNCIVKQMNRYEMALKEISSYDDGSKFGKGICYYGCDTPYIAQKALKQE